jgi:aminomethyltransferase
MSRHSPLHAVHERLGATMTDFAGWSMPVRYDSDLAEHHAVRQRAGLFDLSHMGEVEVRGPQAAEALDHAFVGDLTKVAIGRAKYTMLCAQDGGVLDDVVVYHRAVDRYLVVANAANVATVLTELRRRCTPFDVEVADHSDATALIALQGPSSAPILTGMGVPGLADLRYYAGVEAQVADAPVWLARTGYTGEDGFELYVDAHRAESLWDALHDAGRIAEAVPAGLACRDTLRLEAGMPLYGQELSLDRTPFDAGLGRIVALSSSRGFVGRDALVAAKEAGPAEQLVGLTTEGRRAPRTGYPVLATDGTPVGEVTSGALSPTLGIPIAMAYVAVEHAEVGAALQVDVRGTALPATVVELPFYRRSR